MNPAAQIMGLDRLSGLFNITKYNGGLRKLLRQQYRVNDVKCGEWIEDALNNSCKTYSECFRLTKDNSEENCSYDAMMTSKLLRWFNYIINDCFLLVPDRRMTSCYEDLQLWKLLLNLSTPQLTPPMNIWDCFSLSLPPQTMKTTQLFASGSSDGESRRYYSANTKNNMKGSVDSADDAAGHSPKASIISNLPLYSTVRDATYSSKDRTSLRDYLTNRNLSKPKPKIYLESCTIRRCNSKTCGKPGILSSTSENLRSLRKKHIDCSSELEIKCNEPRRMTRRRITSKKSGTTVRIDRDKREEKDEKLHIESKIVDDLSKAMQLSGEENKNASIDHRGKQSECIMDSKECGASSKGCSSQETDSINNPMHCGGGGKPSSCGDNNPKKPCDGPHIVCKPCGQEKGDSCGEKKPKCCPPKKRESSCGGEPKKCGGGGSCKDDGTCVPHMHRKEHPCDPDLKEGHKEDDKVTKRKARRKEQFNKKLKLVRIKYKIEHCRRSKVIWGRSDFTKTRNKQSDICQHR